MWTHERIAAFIKDFGFISSFAKGEIKALPTLLRPDEDILAIVEGMLQKIHNRDSSGFGIAILTNKRFMLFRKSILGTTQEEIPISRISSVSYRSGIIQAGIAVYTSNNESIVDHCDKGNAKKFVEIMQAQLHDEKTQPAIPTTPEIKKDVDATAELEKWYNLKEKGIITDDEFQKKKLELLK